MVSSLVSTHEAQEIILSGSVLIDKLKNNKISHEEFHIAERDLIQKFSNNLLLLINQLSVKDIQNLDFKVENQQDAIFLRYVLVPIIYRLGLSLKGSLLQQQSFEALLPELNSQITSKLRTLFGNLDEKMQIAREKYNFLGEDVWSFESRVKSNHSIWKKGLDADLMDSMDLKQFNEKIHDLIGLTYEMKIPEGGNRHDALILGVKKVKNDESILGYTNQLVEAKGEDFELEPIVKFKCNYKDIPIDLQFHGGLIFGFMATSVYYKYKGFDFDNIKSKLTKDQWYRRLGLSLFLYENNRSDELANVLKDEISLKNYDYDAKEYKPDHEPNLQENIEYIIPGTDKAAYMIAKSKFTSLRS